ncbi:uncharacterized protein LOC129218637 [Uloborus diversus]|uniref:uncharacterized protein LOC129218637 n=1 Tax=Uloborus diversus TaxID=327109 RepID=UPI0024098BAF|nr:uncharacterized protein LOC129218637 [Uloborus diversus]
MAYPVISTQDVSTTKKDRWLIKKQKEDAKNRIKSMKRKEYQKLRVMVPSIASKPNVSKVTVIEEAVRYIDQLHVALLTKLEEQESSSVAPEGSSEMLKLSILDEVHARALGGAALELMKKADFSLYKKLREEMENFARWKFDIIDQTDKKSMMDGGLSFTKN